MGKTCYFIGHRYGDVNIERLVAEIERHIVEYGVDWWNTRAEKSIFK